MRNAARRGRPKSAICCSSPLVGHALRPGRDLACVATNPHEKTKIPMARLQCTPQPRGRESERPDFIAAGVWE